MAVTASHTMIGAPQSSSACLMADVQQCGETCLDATELILPHLFGALLLPSPHEGQNHEERGGCKYNQPEGV
jgi:hypothetical protein